MADPKVMLTSVPARCFPHALKDFSRFAVLHGVRAFGDEEHGEARKWIDGCALECWADS